MRQLPRWVNVQNAATAGLVVIAILSFILSYGNLHVFAEAFGVNTNRAWLWPAIVDVAIVVGTILVMSDRVNMWTRSFLVAATAVSVFGNGWVGWVNGPIGVGVHIVAPLLLLTVTHIVAEDLRKPAANTIVNTPAPEPVNTTQPATSPTAPTRKAVHLIKPTNRAGTRGQWTRQARTAMEAQRTNNPGFTPTISWVMNTTGCSKGTASKITNDLKALL